MYVCFIFFLDQSPSDLFNGVFMVTVLYVQLERKQ